MNPEELHDMLLARFIFRWAEKHGIEIESTSTNPGISATSQQPAVHIWNFSWEGVEGRQHLQSKDIASGAREVASICGVPTPEEWTEEDMKS